MEMYERILRMTPYEMQQFLYWVYMNGNEDGKIGLCDSPPSGLTSYFGGAILRSDVKEVMPNNNVNDLWDEFETIYRKRSD